MKNREKYSALNLALLAAGMMLIIMLPSILKNHGIFIIRGDYLDQYILRLIKAKEVLSSGAATWDWFNFLGTSYNKIDVLFSLNSVCLLFPSKLIPYAVTYMHLFRFALVAVCAFSYLRYMTNSRKSAFLGAILYTFSSYTFLNFEFMQFIEALWIFPLILLSAEKMFRAPKYKHQLVFTAFLSCSVSFYFFIFSTLLFSVYFLCRFFCSEEWQHKRHAKFFLLAVLEYVLGLLCAFFVFTPFIYKMFTSAGSSGDIGSQTSLLSFFYDDSVFARFFSFFLPASTNRFNAFGISAWRSYAAYLPVFSISFVLAYLIKGNKKWLKILCIFSFIAIILPAISLVFNVFSSGYTRFAYGIVLFFVLATVSFIENYDDKTAKKGVYITLFITLLLLLLYYTAHSIAGSFPAISRILYWPENERDSEQWFRTFALISAVFMYAILLAYVHSSFVRKHIIPIVAVLITLYGMTYVTCNLTSAHLLDYYPESMLTLDEQAEKYLINTPELDDTDPYRIDFSKQWRNYAYTMNKPSITVFESVRNRYTDEMTRYIGLKTTRVIAFPDTTENSTRTLLSVKYYLNLYEPDRIPIPDGFSYYKTENDIDIYKNDNFIGMGFSYDSYLPRSEFEKLAANKENSADIMLNTLVVEDDDADFVSSRLPLYSDGHICTERVTLENFEINSSGFRATLSSPDEQIIFVPIAYEDRGWTAEINGEKAEFIRANIGCIAFKTQPGENVISFKYKSPVASIGLYISIFSWIVCAAYILICKKYKKGV